MAKKKEVAKSKRYRMTKLQKFYIDGNLDKEPKSLAIELGIPEDVIDRYMKKSIREAKSKEEEVKPITDDQLMGKNEEYGAVVMTEAAAHKGDASRGAGLKSNYYNDAITKIRQ